MAAIGNDYPTLLDLAKVTHNGQMLPVVELLTKTSPLLQDMVWQEGNLTTGHRIASRTALPAVAWRRLNEGVSPSKVRGDTVDESCGLLSGKSQIDKKLAELNGGLAYRASQDKAFAASMTNELETGFFYHSTKTDPEKIMGFSPRLDATANPAGANIIKADAAAAGNDQASIWLIGWGPGKVYGIYPKGTAQGLDPTDMGLQQVDDGSGGGKSFPGYVTFWDWWAGLAVEDWRYVVRIANIDTGNLLTTGRVIIDAMIKALEQIQSLDDCKPVFYMNRTLRTYLRNQSNDAAKNQVTFDTVAGKQVMMFGEVPVRRTDALLSTESPVV